MNMKIFPSIVLVCSIYLATSAAAAPKNYDECILENIAATSTEAAVKAIMRSCRNLFPIEQQRETPKAVLVKKRLKANQTDWVGNETFGYQTFRVAVTNNTDIRFKFDEVVMEYRIVGCGDNKATADEIKQIQKALGQRGFDAGRADGKFGSKTKSAIKSFQSSQGLLVSGDINKVTAERLGVSLSVFDENRFMRFTGLLKDVVYLEPNKTALVDFSSFGHRISNNDCFQYRIFGETYQ